ncbi:MAG: glutathione S-transferase N-terminal domain-containing protein [Dehalococcoidia bacterium]|nr:glutathione S-transferase N-terminal domain-containing protein [Dehalococcoidia bacterium]
MQDEIKIKMYGTEWCPDCALAKYVFDQRGISYKWIDISTDSEAVAFVEKTNNGNRSVPTIIFPDGTVLVEPSKSVLEKKLDELCGR